MSLSIIAVLLAASAAAPSHPDISLKREHVIKGNGPVQIPGFDRALGENGRNHFGKIVLKIAERVPVSTFCGDSQVRLTFVGSSDRPKWSHSIGGVPETPPSIFAYPTARQFTTGTSPWEVYGMWSCGLHDFTIYLSHDRFSEGDCGKVLVSSPHHIICSGDLSKDKSIYLLIDAKTPPKWRPRSSDFAPIQSVKIRFRASDETPFGPRPKPDPVQTALAVDVRAVQRVLATTFGVSSCPTPASPTGSVDREVEEMQVLKAVMDGVGPRTGAYTSEERPVINLAGTTYGIGPLGATPALGSAPCLSQETYADFMRVAPVLKPLNEQQLALVGLTAWSGAKATGDDPQTVWSFSSVGMRKDGQQAMLYARYYCGNTCGGGMLFVLDKIEGSWAVTYVHRLWIS